jgi:signal transduction histidine kinase
VSTTAVTSYWLVRQIIVDSLRTNAQQTVEKAGNDIDQWLVTRVAEIETLANQVAIRSMHLEAVIPFLSLEADRLPEYRFLMYAYPDGSRYRTDQGFVQDRKIVNSPYFKQAIAGKISISGLVSSTKTDPQQVSIAAPIWSASPLRRKISPARAEIRAENLYAFGLPSDPYQKPKPIGALIGVIPIKHIAGIVATIPKIPGSYAFVIDAQGKLLTHPVGNSTQRNPVSPQPPEADWNSIYQAVIHHSQGVQRIKLGDEWMYLTYTPLQRANWSLALVIPKAHLEQKLDALNSLAYVVAVALAIASLIGFQQIRLLEQAEDRSATLAATNIQLQGEIKKRQQVEAELLESQADLENRVVARTAELATANQVLQDSEIQLKHQTHQLEETLQTLQQTQSHLIQTEKMSSLGQLVAGVAHEINNPVNFIHANLPHANQYMQDLIELVKTYQVTYPNPAAAVYEKAEEIDIDFLMDDLPKMFDSMRMGTERIRQLVLSLRNFSRLDEAEMKQVNIHDGLDSTLLILQNQWKAKPGYAEVQIVKDYNNPYLVECYVGQLNQVFMNILANAIDALETLRNNESESDYQESSVPSSLLWQNPLPIKTILPTIWIRTSAQDGHWVEIRIKDNGIGMTESVQKKVFDPFFTTKPVGKGTGIGMSISYQIVVEKHGGLLQCNSEPGNGTEFLIRIPIHQPGAKMIVPDVTRSLESPNSMTVLERSTSKV